MDPIKLDISRVYDFLDWLNLHSMGHYIQEGERTLVETVISVEKTGFEKETAAIKSRI